MKMQRRECPDCDHEIQTGVDRREFLRGVGVAAAATTAGIPLFATARAQAAPSSSSAAETAVKVLFDSLTDQQRKEVAFDWDYQDPKRGLLRTHVSNNWQITKHTILSEFYTPKQRIIIHDIFKGVINPEWYARFVKQLRDDTGGKPWGASQSLAIFGTPGSGKFELVMTGRHMTLRADGNTEEHVAFGGPIFYGHAASDFNEKPGHPGNVFWEQARKANFVYQLLDKKQQEAALVPHSPAEAEVAFQGRDKKYPGIRVSELNEDQKSELRKALSCLIDPFRKEDQEEAVAALQKQGGLDHCSLAFYKDGDIGYAKYGEWDNWRLEGPSFVWYFRGNPHVHVWVNVADDSSVKLNARG